ncbi:pilin glycosylation protein [Anaeromyxobacter sp. K]|uniref:PglD-related sugar-binding protein n=1 Tax=Anaeromyxobacter sp. (strain K) TaxID=447217 RepID=UPI00015F9159|nr:PII uridylyl-transferase [Anaeromyxobacter sp. K]ACG75615.1 pilin glycosylation protein [Anaeromyxobacter sp. K]
MVTNRQEDGVVCKKPAFLVMGAGGHGRVVADAGLCAGLQLVAFIDDGATPGQSVMGAPVLTWAEVMERRAEFAGAPVALAIGDNVRRQHARDRLVSAGFQIATIVHPAATVARSAQVCEGAVVLARAVVNADAVVEAGAIVNTAAVVEHDCVLETFAHLSSSATLSGATRIGAGAVVGPGAVVVRARVGPAAVIAPGARVITDVRGP